MSTRRSGDHVRQALPGAVLRTADVAACVIIAAILVLGSDYTLIGIVRRAGAQQDINRYIVWDAAYALSLIAIIWLVFVRIRGVSFADLGYVAIDPRARLRAVAWGTLALATSWVAFQIADRFIPWEATDYSMGITETTTVLEAVTLAMYAGILGPAAEELMYRGVLFRWMRQRLSFWPAALASSIFFGLVHVYWDAIINAAIAGILFAWLFERSRSLVVPIIAHQTWNTVSVTWTWIEKTL